MVRFLCDWIGGNEERISSKTVNEVGLSPSACAFVFEGFPHCKALNGNKVQMLVCNYGHANEARALPHIDFNSFVSNTLK